MEQPRHRQINYFGSHRLGMKQTHYLRFQTKLTSRQNAGYKRPQDDLRLPEIGVEHTYNSGHIDRCVSGRRARMS